MLIVFQLETDTDHDLVIMCITFTSCCLSSSKLDQIMCFRLAKCSLHELRSVVSVRGGPISEEDWLAVCGILSHLVTAWQLQEKDKARRELEESNYFINRYVVLFSS